MGRWKEQLGHFFLGIVVLTWEINFGIVKSAFWDLPPILFAGLRFTLSGIIIFLLTLWREKGLRIRWEDVLKVIPVGGMGIGLYQILWSLGLNVTSASNSALILSTQPLLGALYMDLVKEESVAKRQYLGMVLALGGVILVILKPTLKFQFSLETLSGDLLTLLAGICSTIFFPAWPKPLLRIYSPLRLMGYCMMIGASVLWIAVLLLPYSIAWGEVPMKTWWSLGMRFSLQEY